MPPTIARKYRAAWVFPVDHEPLRDGVVEIAGGKIISLRKYQLSDKVHDLGQVALIPGLVNAHTHLEFSEISAPLGKQGMDFPCWIREVIAYRQRRDAEISSPGAWRTESIRLGLQESKQAGVAAIGEIATVPCRPENYASNDANITLFLELLGMAPERQNALWQAAQTHISSAGNWPGNCRVGLSPHAPYTVQPELIRRICDLSQAKHFPVAMHLAESLEEMELLQSGSGRLATFLQELNALPVGILPRGVGPLWYLEMLAQAQRALVIHGNYLGAEEIEFLGQRSERMSVVYCPRTHAYFNSGSYPLAAMVAANVNVCFGTDSRATNPNLSLWEDMRFAAERHPQITLAGILHMGTLSAAEALGIADDFGSISPGKHACMNLVKLTVPSANDPHERLFESSATVQTFDDSMQPSD